MRVTSGEKEEYYKVGSKLLVELCYKNACSIFKICLDLLGKRNNPLSNSPWASLHREIYARLLGLWYHG